MAANTSINTVGKASKKLKKIFSLKDLLSFLLFLLLSAGFWFLHALDKERDTTIVVPVRYVGIPANIEFKNPLPQEFKVDIRDKGLKLLSYSGNNEKYILIHLDGEFKETGEISLTSEMLRAKIKHYLLPSSELIEFRPDSVVGRYHQLSQKTVPIQLAAKIETAQQYMLSRTIEIKPSEVVVFGEKKRLDSLKIIKTKPISINNINDTTVVDCELVSPEGVRLSKNKTKVSIWVELFTEKKIQLPVICMHAPANVAVKTFPGIVTLTYNVGLSHFKTPVNTNDIQVFIDYNSLQPTISSRQKLMVVNKLPYMVSNLRVSPGDIEYIFEKR